MDRLAARLGLHSLRGKLLARTLLLIAAIMVAVMAVVEHRQRETIIDEFRRRGEVLARNFAAISQGPLLLYNFTALEQNAARVGAEADVVYAIVLDAEGKVAAYSGRPEQVGLRLEGEVPRRAAATTALLVQDAVDRQTGESLYDFAVPLHVSGQRWGTVRVGLSKRRMEVEILETRLDLAALAVALLLLGAVGAALMARRISEPVHRLEVGAAAIARGELGQRIEPTTLDEIGRLAITFNHMAAELLRQRAAVEDANAELRRRFEEVADLKSYTDSILGSLTTGIVTIDLDGSVVTLNHAAELLTGFFAGEAAGRYCTEVFAHTPEVGEILMEALASHAPVANVQLTLKRRNGRGFPVEFGAAPLRGGDGKELGVVGMFRDLTAVRQLEQRLQRSDRLASLGTLAAGLAHEIKNPLTSLMTFSLHLGRKFDDERFRERFQNVVPRELQRINDIVERLLDLARPSRLSFTLVRLTPLVDGVIELYADRIEARRIVVERQYARDIPPIHADEEALYRALVNLVANAIEAMGEGGRLTVRLGWYDGGDLRPGRHRLFARKVRIEIEDTGSGIPSHDADRIFNPFFTTKQGGTGLGLAIAHKIVEDHGGAIDFASRPGAGTTFRVVLPLAPDLPGGPGRDEEDGP